MGVGNTGDHLKPYDECDFWISTNSGQTWTKARDGPHQYEFGDQGGIVVAIKDEEKANKVWYSFNYGQDWKEYAIDTEIKPIFLTTLPDSTSEKFTLLGRKSSDEYVLLSLSFEGTRDRKCHLDKNNDGGDFEKWYARYDDDGIYPPKMILMKR
jgi:Sortilin, neurotensin receptor 3,/Sortilin, neurotensin receptor 3, C-terminal